MAQNDAFPTQSHEPNAALPPNPKREQILRGAESVFLEHGYEGASMSQIAQRAKVSKGTLYNHFENKADLFGALVEELSRCKLSTLFQRVDSMEGDCKEVLSDIAERFIRMLLSPSGLRLYRIIVSEAPHFPNLADVFWQHGFGRTLNIIKKCLDYWVEHGDLAIDDSVFAAEQFSALCQTRLVHRRRFELPVDCSDDQIRFIAQSVGTAFMKLYGVPKN
ncbi:TetR/AcrR family transcriptional regulator [Kozakia baliensis]|uniref:TetR/AcrR family transcriptional regulator n=1 Tax=Kozakia baliensis TaxID=153496 RepID=UPI00087CC57A|nr:TetR/AcrR family transcriptional regulator [Kozakia baliensis]AOX20782.1 hypothetical protein A0U90_11375 [Kozakia baliensis]